MLKKLLLGFWALLVIFGIMGCSLLSDYEIRRFTINASIYQNRPSNVTTEEHLEYIKGYKDRDAIHWLSNEEQLRDYFYESCGYISNMDEIIQEILVNKTCAFYYAPGLLSSVDDYYFFYVTNNNF